MHRIQASHQVNRSIQHDDSAPQHNFDLLGRKRFGGAHEDNDSVQMGSPYVYRKQKELFLGPGSYKPTSQSPHVINESIREHIYDNYQRFREDEMLYKNWKNRKIDTDNH